MSLDGNGGCKLASGAVQCWGNTVMLGNGDVTMAEPLTTKLTCP
jgi:hypothetical protein